jgi:hypothetical protein
MAGKVFKAVSEALSKPQKKARTRVHEMRITRGEKGGFVAHHQNKSRRDGSPSGDTGPYPLADAKALMAHVQQHMSDSGGAAEPDDGEQEQEQEPQGGGAVGTPPQPVVQ